MEQTALPGIGVRHDLVTDVGPAVGVVSHRNGRRDLVALRRATTPTRCLAAIPLTDDEAEALADLLGASLMLGQLAGLREQAAGLLTEQIAVAAGSPFVGRPLGDTQARTRTSASIVAVLRDARGDRRRPARLPASRRTTWWSRSAPARAWTA